MDTTQAIEVQLIAEQEPLSFCRKVPAIFHTEAEWRARLSAEQFRIGRQAGTEAPFCASSPASGPHAHSTGLYFCAGCGLPLFHSEQKFDSGTGWPSFWASFSAKNLAAQEDLSRGMRRTEIHCRRCQLHLGHRFSDGPAPTGQRYCINSAILCFQPNAPLPTQKVLILGAGCFWGVEEFLSRFPGVVQTEVGYCGGHTTDPTYPEVCSHVTGHAEVVRVVYDPALLPTGQLLELFFSRHDPTTLNRQGSDVGDQYRSAIFFTRPEQEGSAWQSLNRCQQQLNRPIVTQIDLAPPFYRAEEMHQHYLKKRGAQH